MEEHSDRIEKGGKLPYFIADNRKRVNKILGIISEQEEGSLIRLGDQEWTVDELIGECRIEPTENGKIYVHPDHDESELAENLKFARWRAEQFGEEVILLPNPQNIKSPDSYNITRGVQEEYKRSSTPTKNSISQLIRDGKNQADYLIIEVHPDMKAGDVLNAITSRITDNTNPPRCLNLKEIRLKLGDYEAAYKREEISANGFKIRLGDFHNVSASQNLGSSLTADAAGSISDAKLAKFFGLNKKSPKEIAIERHAKRDAAKIQQTWNERRISNLEKAVKDGYLPKESISGLSKLKQDAFNNRVSALQKAANRHAARSEKTINDIKERWAKKQKRDATTRLMANNVLKVAQDWQEVDFSMLQKIISDNNLGAMRAEAKKVTQAIKAMRDEEKALSDLIPNVHKLHKEYTIAEMRGAFQEIDGVMQKWLTKYRYSSLDKAPLSHLKNKLDFELTSPTITYKSKEIIQKALKEKKRIVKQKIEWEALAEQASSLRSFKTKSSVYKECINKIDLAIQQGDINALKISIEEAKQKQLKLTSQRAKIAGNTKTALNKEYKGTAVGKDLTSTFDATTMVSEDPYGGTFTNNAARLQGFDAPAKLVSEQEFIILEKAFGDVFYRTVNPTTFKGKKMTSAEFAAQLYEADLLELNGPGGRVHGDGMYVATSAWDGHSVNTLTDSRKMRARSSSECYGNGNHTLSEMTWVRKPKIIIKSDLIDMWRKLSTREKAKFGNKFTTYGCALGYDAMFCNGVDYMVIRNRSIIAIKKK